MKDYYEQLMACLRSGELRSLSNKDRPHNTTIVRFMLDTAKTVNMYCGKMSVFSNKFYTHVDVDHDGKGQELKQLLIEALDSFISRPDSKLNIIVENFSASVMNDLISPALFAKGMRLGKISIMTLDKSVIVADTLSHCVYTDNGCVRMETDPVNRSGLFLSHIPSELKNELSHNFEVMYRASNPVSIFA